MSHFYHLSLSLSQTGVVQVNRPLDRERVAEYRLAITVKDNPENSRIARRVLPHTHTHDPLSAHTLFTGKVKPLLPQL